MEKIKGFQISSMTVSGFKCYEAPMKITFGNPTIVTGGNGRGKSSLADAIAFAVTGLPFFGERGIDRLHNETNPDLQITMRFTDDTGRAHELTRSRQKDRMSITYDGYAIRQTDLNEMFGERDVFLSIFNPLYFIEELGEDGKKLLARYLPPIPQADVLAQLNAQTQQQAPQQSSRPTQQSQQPLPFTTRQVCQYVVVSVSNQQDMSGQPLVCAVLQNAEGKQAKVYAQGSHPMLMPGAQLYDAQVTMRKQGNVAFYTLDGYQVVQQAA